MTMNTMNQQPYPNICYTLLLACICTVMVLPRSYAGDKGKYGKAVIPKATDTALQQAVTHIRGVSNDLFEEGAYAAKEGTAVKYRLLRPVPNTAGRKHPLVVVFHGSGAVGTDNKSQMNGLVKLWATPEARMKYPVYVLAPQFAARSSNYVKDKQRGISVSVPQPPVYTVLSLIDSLANALNVDRQRIYAVGYSMGASTVINALSLRPGMFAAGVSISGVPEFDNIGALREIPIWLMHGNADADNPYASDAKLYDELKTGNKVRFWEFDRTGHDDIFSSRFLQEQIPEWLWEMRK